MPYQPFDAKHQVRFFLSPLMIAVTHRSSPDVIEILIQYGADVDHQDNYGHTAIMKLLKHPQLLSTPKQNQLSFLLYKLSNWQYLLVK